MRRSGILFVALAMGLVASVAANMGQKEKTKPPPYLFEINVLEDTQPEKITLAVGEWIEFHAVDESTRERTFDVSCEIHGEALNTVAVLRSARFDQIVHGSTGVVETESIPRATGGRCFLVKAAGTGKATAETTVSRAMFEGGTHKQTRTFSIDVVAKRDPERRPRAIVPVR